MGIFNGSISLITLLGFNILTLPILLFAAAFAADYSVVIALAPLFPGTGWTDDPEFVAETRYSLGLARQQLLTYLICALALLAVRLAVLQC